MKILNEDELGQLSPLGRGKNTNVRIWLARLEVGKTLVIEKGKDWITKNPPYFTVRRYAKRSGRSYTYGKLARDVGWYVTRVS